MISKQMFSNFVSGLSKILVSRAPDFSDPQTIELWYDALKDLSELELRRAFVTCRDKLDVFPTIRQLKEFALNETPRLSGDDLVADVVSRIEGSIGKFGYAREDDAKAFIGELGWEIVRIYGGWARLCEVESDTIASLRRHLRDLAKSVIRKSELGILDQAPALPPADSIVQRCLKEASSAFRELKPVR